ncbi:MdtA/MuxA family multidrug efflux RND transporter periplasmic adaptor subunit [Brenneria goodwinii]|uniref:MdtA/MuxA family multidrug efflux RND transporter periplasmic adaptor subunit n=5 Tax=Brenneria goodwinii TaxID=1109412 RepID=UPI000EF1A4A5|nr:MdtA/MuxA family multidrug efflux RND transporter periplasmic adaptor subunit [Brenneria goodwinii]MCG8157898.1 MdtA/MuxA family multidrug efflux RND transporter periplasmic adaptor subunit [Brenneria goodwinii]MCG8172661.1 MdtA/MuxA family multidrug efflux RND transporter periplasmic adaptor subunit [Brenneria goodwinii]MCG8177365.1 MdtA/MuxA family multidrug efflux RND transporter periplasmic adaptor subunit [Brenneria goodwinii]MCG8181091.1 MdtA/MuxA family multidrug efflux RND transporte
MTKPSRSRVLKLLLLVVLVLIIAGVVWRLWPHGQSEMGGAGGPGRPGMMMGGANTLVHAGSATQADVPVYLNALGTVTPNATVTVTSRVDGQLMKVYFTEGQKVEAGQLLAQIDPRSYQATLAQYQAELSENQALLKSAQLTLDRYKKLFAQDSLSRQDLDTQIATVGQYSGAIKADEAQIAAAKLNIEYARITAPISGRVGLRLVDAGNMVTSSDTTGIVTITQTQPVAVTFSVPQSNIPVLLKALHNGQSMPVTAFDQDNKTVLAEGKAQFISNSIDTSTGTVQLKALFDNEDEALYANQFVNVRLQIGTLSQATVIPSQALQLSSDGSFVFVINKDDTVTRKVVKTGPSFGNDLQSILSGVEPGDRVVTEGIDRLTNGSKISIVTAEPAPTAAAGGSAQAQ